MRVLSCPDTPSTGSAAPLLEPHPSCARGRSAHMLMPMPREVNELWSDLHGL